MTKKAYKWFLVIVWAGLIFFLSHQPGLESGLSAQWDFLLRKLAHISEYLILTVLLMGALGKYEISRKNIIVLAAVFSILYAISDEYHQTFISNRHGAIRDVFIDSSGVFLAAWLKIKKMIK